MGKTQVYIETFGCQMNTADTEQAAAHLRASGYEITSQAEEAEVVLFNTCSVRARAEQKVYNRVGEILKNAGARAPLIGVMGCVAQLEGEAIFERAQAVRLVVGTQAITQLPALIERAQKGVRRVIDVGEGDVQSEGGREERRPRHHIPPSDRHSPCVAFVPIIEGCNKFCTYCIVPYSRGRERSRAADEIISEIVDLRRAGYAEVHLIGQNVNSYRPKTESGLEGVAGATPFARLLRAVAATGMARIKFTTSFPRDFHSDIVAAIDEHENLCNWVHLPVQSGSDRVLRAMRRGYKLADYLARVAAIKSARRRLSLTSDVIVGFPGETAEDFEATLRLVEQCQYDGLYIFKYSERAGTPAAKLREQVPEEIIRDRFGALEELQKKIQQKIYASFVNVKLEVLVEGPSARAPHEAMFGHTTCHKVVNFINPMGDLPPRGRVVPIRITKAKVHSLYGEIIAPAVFTEGKC